VRVGEQCCQQTHALLLGCQRMGTGDVLSTSQANAACKQLDITRVVDARRLMQQLRLCCMDGVHAFYTALQLAHLYFETPHELRKQRDAAA
jgi:hypothetical protein